MRAYWSFLLCAIIAVSASCGGGSSRSNEGFQALSERFVDEFPALSPVGATQLGDHRYDGQLNEISSLARKKEREFLKRYLDDLEELDWETLSTANQVDAELLRNRLEHELWSLEDARDWEWNPLLYTALSGGAIYTLLAREFAPLEERLENVASRLEQVPRFLRQVRKTLKPGQVPEVHAQTAVNQNRGLVSIIDNMLIPDMEKVNGKQKKRLQGAIETARVAINKHQEWLEQDLLPKAAGDFRIGKKLFDKKLEFTLHTTLDRESIKERATAEYHRVRQKMYEISRILYLENNEYAEVTETPDTELQQTIIRFGLEQAYLQLPAKGEIVELARQQLEQATEFVREKDLVTVPDDPVEIILMPEFRRGVSFAYCDSPGPLDVGQKTFYAVAPLPETWDDEQIRSFLREYNTYSMQDLTLHEAMPGHYLQLAHSNRYPSTLRAILASGPFIEGWAVYAEKLMVDNGYLEHDPLMHLINLKWYLRGITNALMDQAIHADGMTENEAMKLMLEGGFQEEREAAGKWTRAQLTSTQLSTYFVGYQEHIDLRRAIMQKLGDKFDEKKYHDELLSYGSPPGQFVKALMEGTEIPRQH